ncbi:MAG: hypothetical protein ACFFA0_10920 [Promethearchaeota archaeon]
MNYRFVTLIYPHKSKDGNLTRNLSLKVPLKNKNNTIYDTVDQIEKEIDSKIKKTIKEVKKPVFLRDVINLHNINGIKNMELIRTMIRKIKSGKEILSPHRLPNIKLVKTKHSEWILFDGHHSLLSYMIAGKKCLHEVPHLIVKSQNGYVNDSEILVFFGIHSKILNDSDWRTYVINWQASKEKQLCKREQKNMGELFDKINDFSKKTKI